MATVEVVRSSDSLVGRLGTNHRRMVIMSQSGAPELNVPYAPREVTHDDLVSGVTELPRAVGAPILHRNQPKNRKMSFDLFFGKRDRQHDCTAKLNKLINIANSEERVKVSYGSMETGYWKIQSLSIRSSDRNLDGNISRATVSVTFVSVQVIPHESGNGPASGGNQNSGEKDAKNRPKFHEVKEGDTLRKIALKHYKNADMWKKIAEANDVKHPNNPKPGRKLRLP